MATERINDAIDKIIDDALVEIDSLESLKQYKWDYDQRSIKGKLYGILKIYLNENGLSENAVSELQLMRYRFESVERDEKGLHGLFCYFYD